MNTENWKPGHSTTKGYPYERIESREFFPNRPTFLQDEEGRVGVNVDTSIYPDFPKENELIDSELIKNFLFNRAFDFQEALKVAEDQIAELLTEDPFIPEDFGFEIAYKPESVDESPIRLYQSKYSKAYTLYRPVLDTEKDFDPSLWVLQKKSEDGTFSALNVSLPCHRIAYAFFYAMQIQMQEVLSNDNQSEEAIEVHESVSGVEVVYPSKQDINIIANPPAGFNNYNVDYRPNILNINTGRKNIGLQNIIAADEKDAQTQAKFLIETGDYGVDVVEFNELYVKKIIDNQKF